MTTLEKARAEIVNTFLWEGETEENLNDSVRKCLEIIDKYAEQEPCDDAVSRQAVLDVIDDEWICNEDYDFRSLAESIEQLPSVRPQEPKTGRWIKREDDEWYGEQGECAICGHVTIDVKNFCPNCGARMVEPQDIVRRKGTPRENYEPIYNCENWIP